MELKHHGVLGMHWGERRYQNYDGTLTEAGRRRLEKRDNKWAKKNYSKVYNKAFKESKKDMQRYMYTELSDIPMRLANGKLSKSYINAYNQRLAVLMSSKVSDLRAPSGKIIQFVAKRGEIGVHMALADAGYDMSQLKNGVYGSGRIAYKKKSVDMA